MSGPRTIEFKSTIALCHRQNSGKRGKAETIYAVDYLSAVERVAHGDEVGPCADGREKEETATKGLHRIRSRQRWRRLGSSVKSERAASVSREA